MEADSKTGDSKSSRSRARGRWNLRVSEQSDTLVRRAAALAGQSVTAFVTESALNRAEAVISERQRIVLSDKDFDAFSRALEEPPTAVPELVDLFRPTDQ